MKNLTNISTVLNDFLLTQFKGKKEYSTVKEQIDIYIKNKTNEKT